MTSISSRPENQSASDEIFLLIKKTVLFVTGFALALFIVFRIGQVLLLFLAAFVFTLILHPLVSYLEKKGVGRGWASVFILLLILFVVGLFIWFLLPRLSGEFTGIIRQLPRFVHQSYSTIKQNRALADVLPPEKIFVASLQSQVLPTFQSLFARVSGLFLSFFDLLVVVIFVISMVVYSLIDPRPIIRLYLELFPLRLRGKAAAAFREGYRATLGWMKSVVVSGIIEAVAAFIFLLIIGIPAALLWGALAFFAELIPRVSSYVMIIPPFLVALSIDPVKALWVVVFYALMGEIVGNFIAPRVRSSEMNINAVFSIFMVLAMGYAFGITGLLISTPVAGFIKAFWTTFYRNSRSDPHMEERVSSILDRS